MVGHDETDGISVERLLFALSDPRRRRVIDTVQEFDSIEVSDLADEVTLPEEDRKTVYISLTQTHIDVLSEAGVIEVRPIASLVRRGPHFTEAQATLSYARDAAERSDPPAEN